jgi:signal transduction histidine kinase
VAITSNSEKMTVDEWQLRAEAELFHLHFSRWRVAIVGALSLIAVVGGTFLYLTQNVALWWWLALQTGAYLLQAAFCLLYERKPPQPCSSEFSRWMWIWTLLTAITGLISGALIFWIPADQLGLLLAAIMVSGTFAIGEASASGHERLVFAAVISQTLMACIALVLHAKLPLAVIIYVLFAVVVAHFGLELNRAMRGAIVQRLRAQQLVTQLEQGQQRLLEAQHQQSVLLERQRVMQDMHDGLGSALSSSLVLLERGEVTVPQAAVVMRECVDDLRLVVDSLEPTSKDISTLLGMLRYRLQHRLDAAGVRLHWQMGDLPVLNWLEPSLALDLLRLTQEAIVNILKHSAATELTLVVQHNDNTIELIVHDNGCGFDLNTVSLGRGLRSQSRRAERLGGKLKVDSTPGSGTFLCLRLPVNREPKA